MSFRLRRTRLTAAISLATIPALLLGPTAAGAASPPREAVAATAAGLTLRLPGVGTVSAGTASIASTDAPSVVATGNGLSGAPGAASTATVDAVGDSASDPPEAGTNCATPALPALLAGLQLGLACSSASAHLLPDPSGAATATIGGLTVDGSLLAEALIGLLLNPLNDVVTPLGDQVEAAVVALQDAVLTEVIEEVAAQCAVVTGPVPIGDVIAGVGGVLTQIGLPSAADELAATGQPCVVLAALIEDIPLVGDGELPDLIALIAAALRDALSGVPLVDLSLGGSDTVLTSTAGTRTVEAKAAAVGLSTASLAGLIDAIDAILADAIDDPFIGRLTDLLSALDDVPALPTVAEALATVLDLLDLPLLTLDEPLLAITAAGSTATATWDVVNGTFTTAGVASSVTIRLSPALAELVGADASVDVAAGQSATILADTPLESTISVGDVRTFEDTLDGLSGGGVAVSGVDLALFSGLPEGGIGVGVGNATATARGAAGITDPTGNPSLPTTGGGMVLASFLAAAGAFGLRRRA